MALIRKNDFIAVWEFKGFYSLRGIISNVRFRVSTALVMAENICKKNARYTFNVSKRISIKCRRSEKPSATNKPVECNAIDVISYGYFFTSSTLAV